MKMIGAGMKTRPMINLQQVFEQYYAKLSPSGQPPYR